MRESVHFISSVDSEVTWFGIEILKSLKSRQKRIKFLCYTMIHWEFYPNPVKEINKSFVLYFEWKLIKYIWGSVLLKPLTGKLSLCIQVECNYAPSSGYCCFSCLIFFTEYCCKQVILNMHDAVMPSKVNNMITFIFICQSLKAAVTDRFSSKKQKYVLYVHKLSSE